MENLISELLKFSNTILEIGNGVDDNRIEEFEKLHNLILPADFKQFNKKINGFNLMGTEIYGFDITKDESIENVYHFEHFEIRIPQYNSIVPFSPDGRGNFYCIDTLNRLENGDFPIVFWVSNYEYTKEDTPEITHNNFFDWVKEIVIDWTLENYDYNGIEK